MSQHVEEAVGLLTEIIKEPVFDSAELEKRRRVIVAAIQQQEDDLSRLVFKLFRKALYEKHPYRMDTLGTIESIQKLTSQELKTYYQRVAVPDNMVFTVVGDVDAQQVISAVKGGLWDLTRRAFSFPILPQEISLQKTRRVEVTKKKEQAHFVLGFMGTTFH